MKNKTHSMQELKQALYTVQDPELRCSIVDLGLIYNIVHRKGTVYVTMTLTTPLCPMAPQIASDIKSALAALAGVNEVIIDLVWDPPWDASTMASDEIKDNLGLW